MGRSDILTWRVFMPVRAAKLGEGTKPLSFGELDRVKVTKAVTSKGRRLRAGLVGTVVYCHGVEAYEVEFPGVDDFFQIPAACLEKA